MMKNIVILICLLFFTCSSKSNEQYQKQYQRDSFSFDCREMKLVEIYDDFYINPHNELLVSLSHKNDLEEILYLINDIHLIIATRDITKREFIKHYKRNVTLSKEYKDKSVKSEYLNITMNKREWKIIHTLFTYNNSHMYALYHWDKKAYVIGK